MILYSKIDTDVPAAQAVQASEIPGDVIVYEEKHDDPCHFVTSDELSGWLANAVHTVTTVSF